MRTVPQKVNWVQNLILDKSFIFCPFLHSCSNMTLYVFLQVLRGWWLHVTTSTKMWSSLTVNFRTMHCLDDLKTNRSLQVWNMAKVADESKWVRNFISEKIFGFCSFLDTLTKISLWGFLQELWRLWLLVNTFIEVFSFSTLHCRTIWSVLMTLSPIEAYNCKISKKLLKR